jgi:hypothetical protein
MRTRSLFVSSIMGVALLGLAGSASAAPLITTYSAQSSASANGGIGTAIAICPSGIVVGGGMGIETSYLQVGKNGYYSGPLGVGWEVDAKNTDPNQPETVAATVNCLTGAPWSATLKQVTGTQSVSSKKSATATTATCPSGYIMIAGGYIAGTTSTYAWGLDAFLDSTASTTTWKVSMYNPTSSSKTITALGLCLKQSSGKAPTMTQTKSFLTPEGISPSLCYANGKDVGYAVGGGFTAQDPSVKGNTLYTILNMFDESGGSGTAGEYDVDMEPAPDGGSITTVSGYAECMKFN